MTAMTLEQIREQGLKALAQELGPTGMARFLQLTETGHGDYSRERHAHIGKLAAAKLVKQIRSRRKARAC
jgi:hypothetical protein